MSSAGKTLVENDSNPLNKNNWGSKPLLLPFQTQQKASEQMGRIPFRARLFGDHASKPTQNGILTKSLLIPKKIGESGNSTERK